MHTHEQKRARRKARPALPSLSLLALTLAFAPLGHEALAQDQAATQSTGSGTVKGRVLNASSGQYMSKARVTVEGTNIETFTDNSGEYQLRNVPAGDVKIVVTYTGESPQVATVTVKDGVTTTHDAQFASGATVTADGTVVLDPFVVTQDRFKNAQQIAIQEERFSINLKNVVSTTEFGEIPGGNVGEFVKYLPGVELEYGAIGGSYVAPTDAYGVSVRGFGAEDTNILIDGVPVTSASVANLTNAVALDMLSINNASRIELIKVPTPDMRMNSVGGQINLISKSAFEYAKPAFNYKTYVVVNSEHLNPFSKVAGATDKKVYAGQPGFELSYVKPISQKFGFSLSASRFSQYSANRRLRPEYGISTVKTDLRPFGGANNTELTNENGVVSAANPFLSRVSVTDAPRTSESWSGSMRLDYKPLDGLSLSGNYQYSTYEGSDTSRRVQFRIQRPADWGADFSESLAYLTSSQSANGSSYNPSNSLGMDIESRDKSGNTHSGYVRANYKKYGWEIEATVNRSRSRASYKDVANGHFSGVDVSMDVGTMKFLDVKDGVPGQILVYDRTGKELSEVDYTTLSSWKSPTIKGKQGNAESEDVNKLYQVDIRRDLNFLPFHEYVPLSLKMGYLREETDKVKWGKGTNYRETYVGPAISASDILDTTYAGTSPGWGLAPQEFISTYKLYDVYKQNPENFKEQGNDAKENYFSAIGQTKAIYETNEALYAMIDGSAFNGRLTFLAGLRDETTTRDGYGPQGDSKWNYVKNADGTLYRNEALLGGKGTVLVNQANSPLFATNATGNALRADLTSKGIAFPSAVVAKDSLEEGMLQRKTTPIKGESKGDPNYNIGAAFEITKNLVARLSYSITSGRIKIEDEGNGLLSSNQNTFSFNEDETIGTDENGNDITKGSIKVANPNLLPESSHNWDGALTYYTNNGGKIGASVYLKNIKNYTDSIVYVDGVPEFTQMLDTLGLDYEAYKYWTITTTENGIGTGRQWGYELEASQDLRFLPFLGEFGKNIRIFANYSHSDRKETNTNKLTSRPSAANLASGGISFATKRFNLSVRANWRDYVFNGDKATFSMPNPNGGDPISVGIGEFIPATLKVDVSASYQITKNTSIYMSARNILEEGNDKQRKDALGIYPAYARWDDYRDIGVQITFGVSGSF